MFKVGDSVIIKIRNPHYHKWNDITGVIIKRVVEKLYEGGISHSSFNLAEYLFAIKTDTPVPHSPHRDKYYLCLPSEDFRHYSREPKWRM